MRKLEGFTVNKVVLSMTSINLDRIICFAYSDGSIEYRDRISLVEIYTQGSLDRFSHLSQIGFSYSYEEPCKYSSCSTHFPSDSHSFAGLQVAASPTYNSIVQIGCDGKIKWKTLTPHVGDIGSSIDEGLLPIS